MSPNRTLNYGAFSIVETSFGFQSYDKEGKPLIFSATEQECSDWTHSYMKEKQDRAAG